jgi:hypothetical protein
MIGTTATSLERSVTRVVCCGDATSRARLRGYGRGVRDAAAQDPSGLLRQHDEQGNPRVVPEGGSWAFAWSMCPGNGAPCFAARPGQASFTPGPTSAGTVVRADGWDGQPLAFRATWLGTVTSVAPPVLRGRAIVGTQVVGSAGSWSGGWGGERSDVRVQACRTRDARSCEVVGTRDVVLGEPKDRPVTISARYAGWYVFAVDVRQPAQPSPMAAVAVPLTPVQPGQTIAFSAPVGPVVGPTATLRRRALYRGGRPQLGTVRCPVVRCTAVVKVRREAVMRTRTLRVTGTGAVAPRLQLRPGVWRVTVTIGGAATQRRVTIREP